MGTERKSKAPSLLWALVLVFTVFLAAGCREEGTLILQNNSANPDCSVPTELNETGAFPLEPGTVRRFTLETGFHTLTMTNPTGGCRVADPVCTFEIFNEDTTLIEVDDFLLKDTLTVGGCL